MTNFFLNFVGAETKGERLYKRLRYHQNLNNLSCLQQRWKFYGFIKSKILVGFESISISNLQSIIFDAQLSLELLSCIPNWNE